MKAAEMTEIIKVTDNEGNRDTCSIEGNRRDKESNKDDMNDNKQNVKKKETSRGRSELKMSDVKGYITEKSICTNARRVRICYDSTIEIVMSGNRKPTKPSRKRECPHQRLTMRSQNTRRPRNSNPAVSDGTHYSRRHSRNRQ